MKRILLMAAFLLALPICAHAQNLTRVGGQISSATTTTVVAGVSGQRIQIIDGSVCVAAGGVQTAITIQDSTAVNYIGTSAVYTLAAGSCLNFLYKGNTGYGTGTTAGAGLQVVTGAAGPVTYYFEVTK